MRLKEPLPPGSTIGILGGGQLGRMFAMAARRLGYRLVDHRLELYALPLEDDKSRR